MTGLQLVGIVENMSHAPYGLLRPGRTPSGAEIRIRLLMLTDRRLNEIQTLPWEVVYLDLAKLRLRDSKMGARMMPLSRAAVSVLSALPRPRCGVARRGGGF